MSNLNVINDLRSGLSMYALEVEDSLHDVVISTFPRLQCLELSIESIDAGVITATFSNGGDVLGYIKAHSGTALILTLQLEDGNELKEIVTADTTELLNNWNNYLVADKCIEFATTEYYRSQLSGITPYLIRFQARVKDFPASYHAVTVHVLKGETTMDAINQSILSTAKTLYPNSLVTKDEVILVGVLPYSKMAREYYTIDQWGYSIKPEALSVYAKELLNVPVDL